MALEAETGTHPSLPKQINQLFMKNMATAEVLITDISGPIIYDISIIPWSVPNILSCKTVEQCCDSVCIQLPLYF